MNRQKQFRFLWVIVALFLGTYAFAQGLSRSDIVVDYKDSPYEGQICVNSVQNLSDKMVTVLFLNEYNGNTRSKQLRANEKRDINYICNLVMARLENSDDDLIVVCGKKKVDENSIKKKEQSKGKQAQTASRNLSTVSRSKPEPAPLKTKVALTTAEVIANFVDYIDRIPFLSTSAIEEDASRIQTHIDNLRGWQDKEDYISKNSLNRFIRENEDSIEHYEGKEALLINSYLRTIEGRKMDGDPDDVIKSLQSLLADRLEQRKQSLSLLIEEIRSLEVEARQDKAEQSANWLLWAVGAGIAVLLLLLVFLFWKSTKRKKTTSLTTANSPTAAPEASAGIVVRRKTTQILKKQNVDDVIDNDAYREIACADFCNDSAVRKMYLKNTCIKDIYNMYAEDLRNPDNPKEDGCMVLGRWVHDEAKDEYYVSLEQVVKPGDDAVFAEYELNFGGKIKLKVAEMLRKLRRETNLQYDLTCWVHSHPGLGVFFSNADSGVHEGLKHATHPHFLTAIVVDILTPEQEMGIFTFKHDGTVNSKNDLKKLYSLEQLYKWAVDSDRNSFRPEDHYNTLGQAHAHVNDCHGIELSNGAIIDMGLMADTATSGMMAFVHGFSSQQGPLTEQVAVAVSKQPAVPDQEHIGCFVVATHCSIPSVRKAISPYIGKISFVLVYTTTDGLLTSIPVKDKELCTDERYYGEQKLEDLKIWTRRKR